MTLYNSAVVLQVRSILERRIHALPLPDQLSFAALLSITIFWLESCPETGVIPRPPLSRNAHVGCWVHGALRESGVIENRKNMQRRIAKTTCGPVDWASLSQYRWTRSARSRRYPDQGRLPHPNDLTNTDDAEEVRSSHSWYSSSSSTRNKKWQVATQAWQLATHSSYNVEAFDPPTNKRRHSF